MTRILGWIGAVPHALLLKGAILILVCALGYVVGNHHATVRALNEREQEGADTMRKNHAALISFYASRMKELRLAREQQADADAAAYQIMQMRKADADRALVRARAQLKTLETAQQQKLAEVRDETKALPPAPGCVLPASLRQSLNAAIGSLNNRPDVGYSEAPASRLPDGTSATVAPLACSELVAGLINTLEHDAMLTAWVLSWQAWASEALK